MKKYKDKNTDEIETYEQIEKYYDDNPEIRASFDNVNDLISQCYEEVEK